MSLSEEEIRRLFRIRKTVMQMLRDRGYLVGEFEINTERDDFVRRYGENMKREDLIISKAKANDNSDQGEVIMNEINRLQEKGLQLMEENEQLRQMVDVSNARKQIHTDTENVTGEEGPASESFTNSAGASQDCDCFYTSLKLGTLSVSMEFVF